MPSPPPTGSDSGPRGDPGRAVLVARGVVFTLILVFLCSGTVLRQGLDLKELRGVRLHSAPEWIMFSGVGLGLTQVRFVQVHPDGSRSELDRFAVLDTDVRDQPRRIWRVHGRKDALRLGRQLCEALGPQAEVRMFARTARRTGWVTHRTHTHDLCDGTLK